MYEYKSPFAMHIEGMLSFKESLGYSKSTHEPSLRNFDRFCMENYPEKALLSEEIVLSWLKKRPQENSGGLKKRDNTIRQFGKYLTYMGHQAYILPANFVGGRSGFIPYIFSDEELASFFAATDVYPKGKFNLHRQYVVSFIFRLIYCCGLRPNEARLLETGDVDLTSGRLTIKDTKMNKDRIVMMADDVAELCCRYDKLIKDIFPQRTYFFPNIQGSPYAPNALIHLFRQCWGMAGGNLQANHTPRIYDLRHRFATASLMRCLSSGQDMLCPSSSPSYQSGIGVRAIRMIARIAPTNAAAPMTANNFLLSFFFAALPISAAQATQIAAAKSAMPSVSHSQDSSYRIFMRSSSPVR